VADRGQSGQRIRRITPQPKGPVAADLFGRRQLEVNRQQHPYLGSTRTSHGNTYKVTGKRFNGATQNNIYGDDVQMATNYPLVRITNTSTGHVLYCRTHNFSFMGVATGRKKVSTQFDVPSKIEKGARSLVVVTNGYASSPVTVTVQ
jgi:hypothetical protein